jgi:hypothetical protein
MMDLQDKVPLWLGILCPCPCFLILETGEQLSSEEGKTW